MPDVGGGRPWTAIIGLLMASLLFAALGVWQVHRLAWKEALIARVTQATTAPPLPFSAPPAGPAAPFEYHRVVMTGHYEAPSTTLVTAATDLGSGYWDMVVLRGGTIPRAVWVNRGFVPIGSRRAVVAASTPIGPVTVTGLIRLAEPTGTWLRANRPDTDHWYSRDLIAMAQARRIAPVASPMFIDAQIEAPRPANAAPVPGLTVLNFPNSHLGYAVTWFTLALLSAGGAILLSRRHGLPEPAS
jgi:surfeit locus 1 family protein